MVHLAIILVVVTYLVSVPLYWRLYDKPAAAFFTLTAPAVVIAYAAAVLK